MLIHKLLIPSRLLDGIEVSTLDVFYDSQFQRRAIVDLSNDNRQFCQASSLSRPPASFAGDDFVASRLIRRRTNNDRLNNTMRLDRLRQIDQVCFIETTPWIARVRRDEFDRNRALRCQLFVCSGTGLLTSPIRGSRPRPRRRPGGCSFIKAFQCHEYDYASRRFEQSFR
jgi:hypothetical protein